MQPGALSRTVLAVLWLVAGVGMVGVAAWLALSRWEVLLTGHPALLAAAIGCAALGLVAVTWALATLFAGGRLDREAEDETVRTRGQMLRRARFRLAFGVPALLVAVVIAGTLVWLRPFPADPVAVAALRSDETVRVVQRFTWYEMVPARRAADGAVVQPTTGFVFSPGARVDPRAYARLLRPLAAAGYLVVVIKPPVNLELPNSTSSAGPMAVYPDVRYWAVGGHSLGGVAAATYADRDPKVTGLVLYASYAPAKLARADLKVVSISGGSDGLATPDDIVNGKPNLPATTRYVAVKGGVHAYFGDYGTQPGDGRPGVGRAQAQKQIVDSTAALLASLKPPPQKR